MTLVKSVKRIIDELARLQTLPAPYLDKADNHGLPRMIGVGNDRSIIVSPKIDDAIAVVADQLMEHDPSLKQKVTRTEWRKSVRSAFGPALAPIDLNADRAATADNVLAAIRGNLNQQISKLGPQEFAFGCTLFGNPVVQPFAIGPVRFEPRLTWLARKRQEGSLSVTTKRRIERAWQGKRLAKRKPSFESLGETAILDTIKTCPFVCSVATDGLAPDAGREKALTAARLSIAAIALLWQTPSTVMGGLNLLFDRSPYLKNELVFAPGRPVLGGSGWSQMPHGPWMKTGAWETLFAKQKALFQVVGEILDYVVSPTGAVVRPKMMNTLTQALLWFHEACREAVTLMAIVNFSATLDALACGGRSGGIRRLVTARLRLQDNRPIRKDGPTMKQAVEEIYSDGRSRTIHGTNNRLGQDWSGTRSLAEQLARACLLACFDWAAKHPATDDPALLSR